MITITETIYKKMPADIQACFNQLPNPGSDEVKECFPETKKGNTSGYNWEESGQGNIPITKNIKSGVHFGDSGNASRFFKSIIYQAKASNSERNKGCEGRNTMYKNNHPTVKPVKLMEYLVKLVSRENAVVLDPFIGSGSTAIACKLLNRKYIGLEIDEEYINIANSRINGYTSEIDDEFETDELISDESETNELTSDKKEYYNSLF